MYEHKPRINIKMRGNILKNHMIKNVTKKENKSNNIINRIKNIRILNKQKNNNEEIKNLHRWNPKRDNIKYYEGKDYPY